MPTDPSQVHALRRARERYKDAEGKPLRLTMAELSEAEGQVRTAIRYRNRHQQPPARAAQFVRRSSHIASVWTVKIRGIRLMAVYYENSGRIVTFLPQPPLKG